MKIRVTLAVLSFCGIVLFAAIAVAQTLKRDLIGLGVAPEVANELSAAIPQPHTTAGYGAEVRFQAGFAPRLAPFVPTLAATPVVGTNEFRPGLNVVPTVALNAAAILGPSTPVPGQHFIINNSGPNAVFVKAGGGATLNGATAGGKIALPSLATVECVTASATNQICLQPVIPTPSAP